MRIFLFYVYILTNKNHTVLYIGVTNDLISRCTQHKEGKIKSFTKKYNINNLVYFERFDLIEEAISREKQLKGYSRAKKIALIKSFNPDWIDIFKNGRIEIPPFLISDQKEK